MVIFFSPLAWNTYISVQTAVQLAFMRMLNLQGKRCYKLNTPAHWQWHPLTAMAFPQTAKLFRNSLRNTTMSQRCWTSQIHSYLIRHPRENPKDLTQDALRDPVSVPQGLKAVCVHQICYCNWQLYIFFFLSFLASVVSVFDYQVTMT